MYKLVKNSEGEISCIVKDEKLAIPLAPDNTDYQAYLKWVSEGNTPLPAESN